MGRPRGFDEEAVLDAALSAFWERGYEGTSVADLVERTGLGKGSLYKAFGDKKTLFLRVLEDYLADGRRTLRAALEAGAPGRAALEDWLLRMGAMAARGQPRRGCLGVNTTVELAAHDPEVRAVLDRHEGLVQAMYADAFRAGQEAGELRADVEPEAAARFLLVFVHGLQALGRGSLEAAEARPLVRLAMAGLVAPCE